MANFTLLPAELRLDIIESLDPTSTFNFALTSTSNWHLCKHTLTFHRLMFTSNLAINAGAPGPILWDTLEGILDDESKGWYIQSLYLPSGRQENFIPEAHNNILYNPDGVPLDQERVDMFAAEAVRIGTEGYDAGSHLADFFEHKYYDPISKGSDAPLIPLLVHHIPFLKKLFWTDCGAEDGWQGMLFRMTALLVDGMMAGYAAAAADGIPFPTSHYSPSSPRSPCRWPIFTHLSTVAIAHYWESDGVFEPEKLLSLLFLPSLRRFVCLEVGNISFRGEKEDGRRERREERVRKWGEGIGSNVKELLFYRTSIDVEVLDLLTKGMEKLARFSYHAERIPARRVLEVLDRNVGGSLVYCCLEDWYADYVDPNDIHHLSPLHAFRTLQTLKCNWATLWPKRNRESLYEYLPAPSPSFDTPPHHHSTTSNPLNWEFDPSTFDPRSLLPSSLTALHLESAHTNATAAQYRRIIGAVHPQTPKLERIFIDGWSGEPVYCTWFYGTPCAREEEVGYIRDEGILAEMQEFGGLWSTV